MGMPQEKQLTSFFDKLLKLTPGGGADESEEEVG